MCLQDNEQTASTRILRQAIADFIVISLLCNEDMHRQRGMRRRVKDAHRDSGPIVVYRVPEQRRTARAAKATADLFRRLIPPHDVQPLDIQRSARDIDRRLIVT